MRSRSGFLVVLAFFLLVPQLLGAQGNPPASTHARRGMIVGGISGGVLGGVGLGTLATGLCEYDCDHVFGEGFLIGLLAGGAFGGLTGLVIGAAIPREDEGAGGESAEPWGMGFGIGPRRAGPSTLEGTDLWVGVLALRPTTSRVRWGLEVAYLGRGRETETFITGGRDGGTTSITNKWRRSIWNLSLVTTGDFSGEARTGGYLLANVGAYPVMESLHSLRTQTTPDPVIPGEVSERSFSVLPGGGIGGGGLWRLSENIALGLESRLHLILGAGDEAVLPVFSAGITLRRWGGDKRR